MLSICLAVIGVWLVGAWLTIRPYRTVRRLLRDGTPAQATVLEVTRAGVQFRGLKEVREKVCCELEVHPSGGASFRTRATQFMSKARESALQPGTVVDIRYNPAKPAKAAIEGQAGA